MPRIVAAIFAIVSLGRFASAANADPPLGPIDPDISFAETGGVWESGAQRGRYRVVVETRCSPEHCRDRLFVQWLVERPEGSPARIAATKYIREVGDLTHVTHVRFVLGRSGTKIEVHHEADGSDEDETLKWIRCLRLGSVGKYSEHEGICARGD